MIHSGQSLTGKVHCGGVEVLAQQAGTAIGQQYAEFAIGAGRLEHSLVALAWQAGHDQVALAPLVPAGAKGPGVIITGIQLGEVLRIEAHRNTNSKGCSRQSSKRWGSTAGVSPSGCNWLAWAASA
ncbi:hypothetical protein D3C76_1458100 [compost metagenome]